ncbi:hypothetical protein CTAYLR_004312 [Chrysophaeum taylorii]|uniref:Phosphatidic acid phosphatase type 2/haloperoxidase domain-containing protein n=1 Tax=Chrysophaeum taylorii TaxID=2483200 RepID=A0AAD7UH99_9STRA|nr:hypothetical protein CTAYLR_004312 [Chrysophaeum taylorii]
MWTPPRWQRPWSAEESWHAQAHKTVAVRKSDRFLTWLDDKGNEESILSYADVWRRSKFVGTWLLGDLGLAAGDRAMLVYAPGPEFFVAFVACLRAGILAVPNYPPDPANLRRGLEKMDIVSRSCDATVGLMDDIVSGLRTATRLWHTWPQINWHNTHGLGAADDDDDAAMIFPEEDEKHAPERPSRILMGRSSFTGDENQNARQVIRKLGTPDITVAIAGDRLPRERDDDDDDDDEHSELPAIRESLRTSVRQFSRTRLFKHHHHHHQQQQQQQQHEEMVSIERRATRSRFFSSRRGPRGASIFVRPKICRRRARRDPKGVMISHRNIWHNVNEIYLPAQRRVCDVRLGEARSQRMHDLHDPSERVVAASWLPQFHDTGLILMLFGPFCGGYHMINCSPLSFLADPLMWLRAVSKYKALWTAAPDFAYQLCTKRATDADVSDIDLSFVKFLFSGVGQRCVPAIQREFAAYFSVHCKLREDTGIFIPSYGLAEHVVATSGENDGLVTSKKRPDLASCGSDFQFELRIVDATTRRVVVTDGTPGELWLNSGSVARGYWGQPQRSEETFRARLEPDDGEAYLRTGDEAFLEDGRLFICGRQKNMIIIGGENIYSDDVELVATQAAGDKIRPGCLVAFSIDENDEEVLCLVLEIRAKFEFECSSLASTVSTAISREMRLRPRRIVFIKQKSIPKTTSGKLRHRATRDALLAGELKVVFDSNPKLGKRRRAEKKLDDDDDDRNNPRDAGFTKWLWGTVSAVTQNAKAPPASPTRTISISGRPSAIRGSSFEGGGGGGGGGGRDNSNNTELRLSIEDVRAAVLAACDGREPSAFVSNPLATIDYLASRLGSDSGGGGGAVAEALRASRVKLSVSSDVITVDELARRVELEYVGQTLVAETRRVVCFEASSVTVDTCIAETGLSSIDLVRLRDAVVRALDVDVNLNLLLRPSFPISAMAEEIVAVAAKQRGTATSSLIGIASTSPVLCLRRVHWIFGLRVTTLLTTKAVVAGARSKHDDDDDDDDAKDDDEEDGGAHDDVVSEDEPTLVLANHHVTPDLLIIAHALTRRERRPLLPMMIAHDKLKWFYRLSGLGRLVEYSSGTDVLGCVEDWKKLRDPLRPMIVAPHGQTLRRPCVSPPMPFWLTRDGVRTVVATATVASNPFNVEFRILGGSIVVDLLLFLAMPVHRVVVSLDVFPKDKQRADEEDRVGVMQTWGELVARRGLVITPYSARLKSELNSASSSFPPPFDADLFVSRSLATTTTTTTDRKATLVVGCDGVLANATDRRATNLELSKILASSEKFEVIVHHGGGKDRVEEWLPSGATLSTSETLAETVERSNPDALFVASLGDLPNGLLASRRVAVVLVNPSDPDSYAATALGIPVLRAPEVMTSPLTRTTRRLNLVEAEIVANVQGGGGGGVIFGTCVADVVVAWVHWLFAEEQVVALGCVLAATRQSPQLVLAIGRAFAITHAWVCYVPKLLCARPRPFWLGENTRVKFACPRDASVHDGSFPSGHAAFVATIAATCWNFGARRITSVVVTCIAIVAAFARVVAGVHYPSDVLVGATGAVILNLLAFGPFRLLPRSRSGDESDSLLVRNDQLVNRQIGVTAAVTAVNAAGIGLAYVLGRGPSRTDRVAWTRAYQKQVDARVAESGVDARVELIDMHKKMESAVTALLAVSVTVFWTTALTREIYVANEWIPYDRDPKHAPLAIALSLSSILIVVVARNLLRRMLKNNRLALFILQILLFALLFVFNLVVVDVIIFKAYENDKF